MNLSVYVSTYSIYNQGSIEGIWVDIDDFSSHFEFMLHLTEHFNRVDPENTNNHEFMFQDYDFYPLPSSLFSESRIAPEVFEVLSECSDSEDFFKALALISNNMGYSLRVAIEKQEELFYCDYSDFRDRILEDFYELNEIPDNLSSFINEDAVFRDYRLNYFEAGGYVFRNDC